MLVGGELERSLDGRLIKGAAEAVGVSLDIRIAFLHGSKELLTAVAGWSRIYGGNSGNKTKTQEMKHAHLDARRD